MNIFPVKYLPEILLNGYGKLSQQASLEQTVNKVESVRLYLKGTWTQCQAMFEGDFYMVEVHYMNIAFDDDFDENQVRFLRPLAAAGLCQSRPG